MVRGTLYILLRSSRTASGQNPPIACLVKRDDALGTCQPSPEQIIAKRPSEALTYSQWLRQDFSLGSCESIPLVLLRSRVSCFLSLIFGSMFIHMFHRINPKAESPTWCDGSLSMQELLGDLKEISGIDDVEELFNLLECWAGETFGSFRVALTAMGSGCVAAIIALTERLLCTHTPADAPNWSLLRQASLDVRAQDIWYRPTELPVSFWGILEVCAAGATFGIWDHADREVGPQLRLPI